MTVSGSERYPHGWTHLAFEEIDSTNSEAMRRGTSGEPGPLWITARRQTSGRGRSGRAWTSADGSLAATLLFRPDCPLSALPQISLVSGVAAHDAIAGTLAEAERSRCRLKWPNDVLIEGGKVSGILVESAIVGMVPVVAIGIGINAGAAPALSDRLVAGLAEYDAGTASEVMSRRLASALAHWLEVWQSPTQGFAAIRASWLARGTPEGTAMTVHAGPEKVTGFFTGLDAEGNLMLYDEAGTLRKFTFGDVALGAPSV